MAIGMTYEQYWYDDPLMVRAFYKADRLRKQRNDETAWLNGLYVLNALSATVGNMFRKGGTPIEYPDEPIMTRLEREREEAKKQKQSEREATWALAWMTSFVQNGKRWAKKG